MHRTQVIYDGSWEELELGACMRGAVMRIRESITEVSKVAYDRGLDWSWGSLLCTRTSTRFQECLCVLTLRVVRDQLCDKVDHAPD